MNTFLFENLSVFLPTYNEGKNIENVVLNIKEVLQKVASNWEILIINDGSADNTLTIAKRLAQGDNKIKVINHGKNMGYGASLKSGLYGAKYSWIAFIDSDGQFDFSEIVNFADTQKNTNADIIIGYYKSRKVSLSKIITSKLWEYVVFFLFGLKVRDIDCGFKLISKKVLDKIPKLESERGAFISSELLIKATKAGFKIVEIPVSHFPRKFGKGTGRDLNVIIQSFKDLFKLYGKN
ncbi:MAG TPA: glycosyltransferase family 2 protein [Patescibacteria group bacterium]|nr:glycosyltransferase family 2 protein [Patescibacteria group bacterium]